MKNIKVLNNGDIFSLEIVCANGYVKKGEYVSTHVHLNVTFLIEGDEEEFLRIQEDENSGVKWIEIEDVEKASNEKWIFENMYKKLIKKVENNIIM